MDILIKETGEEKNLAVIGWATGEDYAADLIIPGLPEGEGYDDMGRLLMDGGAFVWWETLLAEYQQAEDKEEEAYSILSSEEWEEMREEMQSSGGWDIEVYPRYAIETIQRYIDNKDSDKNADA